MLYQTGLMGVVLKKTPNVGSNIEPTMEWDLVLN